MVRMKGKERTASSETAQGAAGNSSMVVTPKNNIVQDHEAVKQGGFIFGGELPVDKINWIKRDERTGLIDVVVENNGCELVLNFGTKQFKELGYMIIEQLKKDEANPLPTNEKAVSLDAHVVMENEKISVEMYPQEDVYVDTSSPEEVNSIFPATLAIKDTKDQQLKLVVDANQAKQIKKKLERFIAVDGAPSWARERCLS